MKKPDLSKCTEEELWKYVAYHLSKAGIDSVLVGGAVVAIYSAGAYRSGDLDFVSGKGMRPKIQTVLESLGFQSVRSRHFEHPACPHLIIEFPPGPVSIGDDYNIKPAEVEVGGQRLKIFLHRLHSRPPCVLHSLQCARVSRSGSSRGKKPTI